MRREMSSSKKLTTKKMAVIGVLGGISIVLGMTPIGFIPIGPTKATIMHIPVLIGAIMEGPLVGLFIGLIFGIFSMFQAIMNPTPVSFVFRNPIVALVPRLLMGVVAYYVYNFVEKKDTKTTKILANLSLLGFLAYLVNVVRLSIVENGNTFTIVLNLLFVVAIGLLIYYINKQEDEVLAIVLASASGTIINTAGVMSLIYFLYGERFATALGHNADLAKNLVLGVAFTNGIPEIILGIIITVSVVKALKNNR